MADDNVPKTSVVNFYSIGGYGFIIDDENSTDVFFHIKTLKKWFK